MPSTETETEFHPTPDADAARPDREAGPDPIFAVLRRLDLVLGRAIDAGEELFGPAARSDPFHGMHLGPDDVARDLARDPGVPLFARPEPAPTEEAAAGGLSARLSWLADSFGLSDFDVDVVLLALAPEIDLRYGRLYAYLQDDVTRRRPSVDLALNLFCATPEEKLAVRERFTAAAPLVGAALLSVAPEAEGTDQPLLGRSLRLDDQVIRLLLGSAELDDRLASFCEVVAGAPDPTFVPMRPDTRNALASVMRSALESGLPARLYFRGPRGSGKRRAASALAAALGLPLLVADLSRAPLGPELRPTVRLLLREASFGGAILYLSGLDALCEGSACREAERLAMEIARYRAPIIVGGAATARSITAWPDGLTEVSFDLQDVKARRDDWRTATLAAGLSVPDRDLDLLAGRFRLTSGQIGSAVSAVASRSTSDGGPQDDDADEEAGPILDELIAAARDQSSLALTQLAQRIEPAYGWDDIVLPADAFLQLREVCARVDQHYRVMGEWEFDRKLSRGKGANALFAGPSGTGKTMAAEVLAGELRLDLYRVDLAGVVSKYIGETEKNLDRIFTAAEGANSILLFDEADALFGKRSEVRDAHDRYANIEISYLLQKMELYEGLAILSTNLRQNLDEAFVRRLAFTIHFPFPDTASRRLIWQGIWPAEAPLDPDLDFELLAERYKLSGGSIKNVALAAAFLAAEGGGPVRMGHVLHAVRREYQKMGKVLSEGEIVAMTEATEGRA
jgi:SpoVK/Ycf46/Vps4 family AAA+-type ATPase